MFNSLQPMAVPCMKCGIYLKHMAAYCESCEKEMENEFNELMSDDSDMVIEL